MSFGVNHFRTEIVDLGSSIKGVLLRHEGGIREEVSGELWLVVTDQGDLKHETLGVAEHLDD